MWLRDIFRAEEAPDDPHPSRAAPASGDISLPPGVIRQLDHLQLRGSRFLWGEGIGNRDSLRRKPAPMFIEHRMYVPGDDVRFVDWKASARHEHYYIRQGMQEKEITVNLLIDTSASMGWGEPGKDITQRLLAAALGYLALSHGDRLYVQSLTTQPKVQIGPITGKGQTPYLMRFLNSLQFGGDVDLEASVHEFSRKASWGGLTYVLSDLLGVEDLATVLEDLPAPSWDVILLHLLHPEEINPSLRGELELVDVESGRTANLDINEGLVQSYRNRQAEWKKKLDLACVENHAFYMEIPTDWPLDTQIIPHLRSVNLLGDR